MSDPRPGSVPPSFLEKAAHWMQILNLTHSWWNVLAWLLKPLNFLVTFKQSKDANGPEYLHRKRLTFGENFVCAGGVWMSSYDDVKQNLIQPQARAFKLAPSQLDPAHLPHKVDDGSLTFLLSLSQKGAGGVGRWEAYRCAFEDHVTETEETMLRMNGDETTQKLFDKLQKDFEASDKTKEGAFFTDNDTGMLDFLLRYLHYVLFGLDPFDDDIMQELNHLHYDRTSAAYYLKILGNVLQCTKFKDWEERFQKVAKIYESSPALSKFQNGQDKYHQLTRGDLAVLCVAMMSLAGMVGPKTLCNIVLGISPLPNFEGTHVGDIDVTTKWDELDLYNRDEVKRYLYECGRLRNPVSNTHKVATADFAVPIGEKEIIFPKGTVIFIPMLLAGTDRNADLGGKPFEFDHNREHGVNHSMIFHSFGAETNGRVLSWQGGGRNMVVEMLIILGQVRRKANKETATAAAAAETTEGTTTEAAAVE